MQEPPTPATELVPTFVKELRPLSDGALAAFDADGTLWQGDIFEDFCAWLVQAGELDAAALQAYENLCQKDELAAIEQMMAFFAGMHAGQFTDFVAQFLKNYQVRWHQEVAAALHHLAAHGFDVVIVSASARLLLEPVFVGLPLREIIGMEFVVDDMGMFTAQRPQPSPAGEGKAQIIQEKYGDFLEFAAGNSILDAPLLCLARQVAWAYGPDRALKSQALASSWQMTHF